MPTLLFVCTANRYRSPIAEACFINELTKSKPRQTWNVYSAGTWTQDGLSAMPEAIRISRQLGLNIQAHRSRVITVEMLHGIDLILVMERGQKEALQNEFPEKKEKIFLLSEATENISYDFPDPVMDPTAGNVAAEICDSIRKHFKQIIELGETVTALPDAK